MEITFLIGNGFDLNLGLKTSYKDFLDYFLKIEPDDEDIIKLQKDIEKDLNTWADVELAWGKYTEKFSAAEKDKFRKMHKFFCKELRKYLSEQAVKIDKFDINKLKNCFYSFYDGLKTKEKKELEEIIKQGSNNIKYNFVNFNYTDNLDRLVSEICKIDNKKFELLHIHGEVKNLLLGVDNIMQIKNDAFRSDIKIVRQLVKPESNKGLKNDREDKFIEMIQNSHIICLYGLSIGNSDKKWWNKIYNTIYSNSRRHLIIYRYKNLGDSMEDYEYLENETDTEDLFFDKAGISNMVDRNKIRPRIHVALDYDLFGIKDSV